MIVNTGRRIRVEVGGYLFERDADTPGLVKVSSAGGTFKGNLELPANQEDALRFVAAYMRTCAEEVDYRKSEVE
jgi:hypothetical protein